MIKILFFASVRDQLGKSEIELDECEVSSVDDIVEKLAARGAIWQKLLSAESSTLVAVNQHMVKREFPVGNGDEVAFFPPVTGG